MTDFHPTSKVPEDNHVVQIPVFWARATYDFAVDAGAQGAINLFPEVAIPSGSIVMGVYINVKTVLTSGGAATCALHVNAADDIDTAGVISGAPWSTTGLKAADLAFGSDPVQLTADRNVILTIGVEDLTAGLFEVLVAYLPPGL